MNLLSKSLFPISHYLCFLVAEILGIVFLFIVFSKEYPFLATIFSFLFIVLLVLVFFRIFKINKNKEVKK